MDSPVAPSAPSRHGELLFLTFGSFSGTNRRLLAALRETSPDLTIREMDLKAELKHALPEALACALAVLREAGATAAGSREAFRYHLYRSRAFSGFVRRRVTRALRQRPADATLQTQSIFNAATGQCPNLVYTDHVALATNDAEAMRRVAPSRSWLSFEPTIYREAAHVFTFGPKVRRILLEEYGTGADKVSVADPGPNITAPGVVETGLDRYRRRSILFVGVDWARKGGPELVEAFRRVRERFPDATLTIAGCDPGLPPAPGVTVRGFVPPDRMPQLFQEASAFSMPSRLEPFGIALVEAMQFALPVVSTTVGEVPSIVRDGEDGYLVPPGDVPALADALVRLLDDPARMRAFGVAGQTRAARYSWAETARRIVAHLPVAA